MTVLDFWARDSLSHLNGLLFDAQILPNKLIGGSK
jgi:hypothetical protein